MESEARHAKDSRVYVKNTFEHVYIKKFFDDYNNHKDLLEKTT